MRLFLLTSLLILCSRPVFAQPVDPAHVPAKQLCKKVASYLLTIKFFDNNPSLVNNGEAWAKSGIRNIEAMARAAGAKSPSIVLDSYTVFLGFHAKTPIYMFEGTASIDGLPRGTSTSKFIAALQKVNFTVDQAEECAPDSDSPPSKPGA